MKEQYLDKDAFTVLRATIDSFTAMPAIILVTSALAGDGKSTVAIGLARAYADADVEVALVNGNPDRPNNLVRAAKNLSPVAFPARPGSGIMVDEGMPPSLEVFRERFGITIVDAGTIAERGPTLQIARIADAVILAVRHGRRRVKEDEQGIAMLTRVGARLVGVVPVVNPSGERRRRSQKAPSAAQRRITDQASSLRGMLRS